MGGEVGVRDLVRSYAALRDGAAAQADSAARLLQFYSVECGLKAAILGKHGLNASSTKDLPADLRTHDLRRLAKALRLSASVAQHLASFRRRHNPQQRVGQSALHDACRYPAT